MTRTKAIPDQTIFAHVLEQLLQAGDKAITFASVAKFSGLAAPTLVQRFGSRDAMVLAALTAAWDDLDAQTSHAAQDDGKSAQRLLKSFSGPIQHPAFLAASLRHQPICERAKQWRDQVETALAERFATSPKPAETAALIFAAWQGRLLWNAAGGKTFRLGEALKRLT
jgi:AcrR family transcriptional regulator